jgi:hypothetical protein
MNTTLTQICEYLRNWFTADEDKYTGDYRIMRGLLTGDNLPELLDGEYFRIVGSRLNDGVYQYPVYGLNDEEFTGTVWRMRIPASVVGLAAEIETFNADSSSTPSPYTSESFGGYSYSKGSSSDGTSAYSWQDAFHSRLRRWRKVD